MSDRSERMTVRAYMARELRKLAEEEEGASLVFATITLFAVSMSIVFVYQMGLVSTDRLTIQNAADAAAYSAAQVEANSLNSIAQINDGMTYLNYVMLRYTIDAVVYSTMHTYKDHQPQDPVAPDWVLMGPSNGDEGVKRYKHVKDKLFKSQGPYEKGLKWMHELNYAGRVIMAATPRLARKAAAEVAGENGASYIAFSEDLDKAFQVGDGDESKGFDDKAYSGGDREFNRPMYERYGKGKRKLPHLTTAGGSPTPEDRELPKGDGAVNWFNAKTGEKSGEYYQVRLCWKKEDWGHPGKTFHLDVAPYSLFSLTPKGPNAHWHDNHNHQYIDFSTFPPSIKETAYHGDAPPGDTIGGHLIPDDDSKVHQPPNGLLLPPTGGIHHNKHQCPICDKGSNDAPRPNGFQSRWAEIKKRDSGVRDGLEQKFNTTLVDHYRSEGGVVPRPLFMREALLRSGITVAAWRDSRGIGDLFPKSSWGTIAVASAQVGLQQDRVVLPLSQISGDKGTYKGTHSTNRNQVQIPIAGSSNGTDDDFTNLFYAKQNAQGGVRFGARLVPIAREMSWHKDLYQSGKGLQALLENRPSGGGGGQPIWVRADRNASGGTPPSLSNLKNFVTVRSDQGLKAFWH